jgi:hypothetical protein
MTISARREIYWNRWKNRETEKRSGQLKQKGLKMKGMVAIREKRGIQWNRSQISVPAGPLFSFCFFYSFRVILWPEEYCNDKMLKFLTGRKV